jgi:hypothetical protein
MSPSDVRPMHWCFSLLSNVVPLSPSLLTRPAHLHSASVFSVSISSQCNPEMFTCRKLMHILLVGSNQKRCRFAPFALPGRRNAPISTTSQSQPPSSNNSSSRAGYRPIHFLPSTNSAIPPSPRPTAPITVGSTADSIVYHPSTRGDAPLPSLDVGPQLLDLLMESDRS